MRVTVYNQEGEKTGTVLLPAEVFGVKMNSDLVHQAYLAQTFSSRQVSASTKTRAERRGGGKKPWKQKGTGRARVGSIRSPIWRKGGVTFGPRKDKVYSKKINKKAKRKALFMVLSAKVKNKELMLVDKFKLTKAKTSQMVEILNNLFKDKITVLVATAGKNEAVVRANKNISSTKTIRADSLNVVDLLSYKYLLIPKEAIKVIKETYLKS